MKIINKTRTFNNDNQENSVTISVVTTNKPIRPAKHSSLSEIKNMISGNKVKSKFFGRNFNKYFKNH